MEFDRYMIIKEIGSGSFGSVWQAMDKQTGELVAIKILKEKYYSWQEILNFPEVKIQTKLMKHANIVKLKNVIWHNYNLCLVFEYMECDLYDLMMVKRRKPFSEDEVKKWCFQVLQGLAYMHGCGIIHWDIKPENLLVSMKNDVKIADFGFAREINFHLPSDEYFGTRIYQAPETLLSSATCGPASDMWAMGATVAELLTQVPLFPGSIDSDQIDKICRVLGCPKKGEWDEGLELAKSMNYRFPEIEGVDLCKLIPIASEDAVDLIRLLCSWNPNKRLTALEALRHPFFHDCVSVPQF